MNPFQILGIPSNSNVEVAKAAYRKLAMKHHPDKGGDEAVFKNVKAAFEQIESGYREPTFRQGFSSFKNEKETIDDIFREMKEANQRKPAAPPPPPIPDEIVVQVSLKEAYDGFEMFVPTRRGPKTLKIPAGTPFGARESYDRGDGSKIFVTTRLNDDRYRVRGFDDQDNIFSAGVEIGGVELDHQIDALDLILGTWIRVEDFLGEQLSVRVPAGFNPLHRLKVAGKGYIGWETGFIGEGKPSEKRANMYVKLNPIFNAPHDIEKAKIVELYNTVQGM